jgi:endogenous inhibitor of DNA gyrase (YacG/DUF329 family)
MGGQEVLYRTVGTLSLTAICAALLFWVTRKLNDPAAYVAAMLATSLVIIEFVLGLIAIWEVDNRLLSIPEEYSWELIFIFAAVGVPAVACVRFLRHPQATMACRVGLVLCAVMFVLWLIGMDSSSWQYWESDDYIYGFGLLTTLCLIGFGTDRRYWRWIGVVCAAGACTTCIWLINSKGPWLTLPQTVMISIAVFVAHANLALRCPLKPRQKWIAYGTVAAVALVVIFWNTAVYITPEILYAGPLNVETFPSRLAAAFGIVAACGSLALVILWRSNQKLVLGKHGLAEALDVASLQVTVICPTCQRKQTLGKAAGACPGCGLRMKVVLEEPRCQACGYSLLMISSDRCPECGASTADVPIAIA